MQKYYTNADNLFGPNWYSDPTYQIRRYTDGDVRKHACAITQWHTKTEADRNNWWIDHRVPPTTVFKPTTQFTIPIVITATLLQYMASIGSRKFVGSAIDIVSSMNNECRIQQLSKFVMQVFVDSLELSDGERESNFYDQLFGSKLVDD